MKGIMMAIEEAALILCFKGGVANTKPCLCINGLSVILSKRCDLITNIPRESNPCYGNFSCNLQQDFYTFSYLSPLKVNSLSF